MRELIDRQTAMETIRKEMHADKDWVIDWVYQGVAEVINTVPTVTRMQEESYQRLIGKKVKA